GDADPPHPETGAGPGMSGSRSVTPLAGAAVDAGAATERTIEAAGAPRTDADVGKVAKTEPAKTEPAKAEPAKAEPAKTEPAKTEPLRPDAGVARTEVAKPDAGTVKVAEPAARAGEAFLVIATKPPGVGVIIDGKSTGLRTPIRHPHAVTPGRHVITFEMSDGQKYSFEVVVAPGETKKIVKQLR
ncbi:PEGA domain-containing protein, partial [Myxococcota bacterium]|nr:PEGA domain-containing protein [Myxococcota bacterium]